MKSITNSIINLVQDCGFEVLRIITDNHAINRHMFKAIAPSGKFQNPAFPEKFIFVMYDFVHIFKNI